MAFSLYPFSPTRWPTVLLPFLAILSETNVSKEKFRLLEISIHPCQALIVHYLISSLMSTVPNYSKRKCWFELPSLTLPDVAVSMNMYVYFFSSGNLFYGLFLERHSLIITSRKMWNTRHTLITKNYTEKFYSHRKKTYLWT